LTGVFGSTVAAQDATPTSKPTPAHKSSQSETDANRASNLIESIESPKTKKEREKADKEKERERDKDKRDRRGKEAA